MSDAEGKRDAAGNQPELGGLEDETIAAAEGGVEVNAAGYRDQLRRQYHLLGLVGLALTIDNAWAALGSSISVSIRKPLERPGRELPPWKSTRAPPGPAG